MPEPMELLGLELSATLQATRQLGIRLPARSSGAAYIELLTEGIAGAFIPEETAQPHELAALHGKHLADYLCNTVRPSLAASAEQKNPQILDYAYQMGRLLAIAHTALQVPPVPQSIQYGKKSIRVGGQEVPHRLASGQVIDFGMGLNGLHGHHDNVASRRYRVAAVSKSEGEAMFLEGVAATHHLPDKGFAMLGMGMKKFVESVPETVSKAGLIVASRCHRAGADLLTAMERAEAFLRPNGLVVAQGPAEAVSGDYADYQSVYDVLEAQSELKIVQDFEYTNTNHPGGNEVCRVIIAQKI